MGDDTITISHGPLVRLWGIDSSTFPLAGSKSDALKTLLASMLLEALPFVDSVPASPEKASPQSSWKYKHTKTFPNSTAPVVLWERTVDSDTLESIAEANPSLAVPARKITTETWALRQSIHKDDKTKGTASWNEFVRCFKEQHAEAEKAFTPSVISTTRLQEWDCSGISVQFEGVTWADWTLKREESVHDLPGPLSKRVFPVLQATASAQGRREFLVVQIAVRPEDKNADPVQGAYSSVERVREVEDGRIEWIMGMTSDVKGMVPMAVQRVGIGGMVAKDVDFFMGWIGTERVKGRDAAVIGNLE